MTHRMHIDMKIGETLQFTGADGKQINVTLMQKSGQRARVAVQLPREVKIDRTSSGSDQPK